MDRAAGFQSGNYFTIIVPLLSGRVSILYVKWIYLLPWLLWWVSANANVGADH